MPDRKIKQQTIDRYKGASLGLLLAAGAASVYGISAALADIVQGADESWAKAWTTAYLLAVLFLVLAWLMHLSAREYERARHKQTRGQHQLR